MNRFASIATTAALAGSLIGATAAANATSLFYLMPISDLTATYAPGARVTFAAVIDLNNAGFASVTVPAAVAFTTVDFTNQPGGTGIKPKVTQPTADDPNNPGTPNFSKNAQSFTTTTSKINGATVFTFQNTVGQLANTDANGTTIALASGTYTLGTFSFPIATTNTNGTATVYLPTPFGYAISANSADGAFPLVGGNSVISGKDVNGNALLEQLAFPSVATPGNAANPVGKFSSLTFKVTANSTGGATPAPSSLIVVAMGAIPAIGVLRRRRSAK